MEKTIFKRFRPSLLVDAPLRAKMAAWSVVAMLLFGVVTWSSGADRQDRDAVVEVLDAIFRTLELPTETHLPYIGVAEGELSDLHHGQAISDNVAMGGSRQGFAVHGNNLSDILQYPIGESIYFRLS